jgi:hypothetical protein
LKYKFEGIRLEQESKLAKTDANALKMLAENTKLWKLLRRGTILTPHSKKSIASVLAESPPRDSATFRPQCTSSDFEHVDSFLFFYPF